MRSRFCGVETEIPGLEADELRDRLLAGYNYILVDEYQDIESRSIRSGFRFSWQDFGRRRGKIVYLGRGRRRSEYLYLPGR